MDTYQRDKKLDEELKHQNRKLIKKGKWSLPEDDVMHPDRPDVKNPNRPNMAWKGHKGWILDMKILDDYLYTASDDRYIMVWDLKESFSSFIYFGNIFSEKS